MWRSIFRQTESSSSRALPTSGGVSGQEKNHNRPVRVLHAPGHSVDIPTLGRFHRLEDPAGAEIHITQPLEDRKASRVNELGAWSISSLAVGDPSSVAPFYESLFGWQTEKSGATTLFRLPGYAGGEPDQLVPRDVVAVMQADAAAAETATARGGHVVAEPKVTGMGFAPLCSPIPAARASPSASGRNTADDHRAERRPHFL